MLCIQCVSLRQMGPILPEVFTCVHGVRHIGMIHTTSSTSISVGGEEINGRGGSEVIHAFSPEVLFQVWGRGGGAGVEQRESECHLKHII